jgi:leader peptidase (prepilin peptidase)/N-methyltransferase
MNIAVAALFGLAFGSFANAAIDRIPRGVALDGRSHCDGCGTTLRARNLVPVISYAAQRGRCSACAIPIGLRTPLVEMGCAAAFAATFAALAVPAAIATCAAILVVTIAAGAGMVKRSTNP